MSIFAPSTSQPLVQVVNPVETVTTLTSSPNPSRFGEQVMFIANVTTDVGLVFYPTGTIHLLEGDNLIGLAKLSNGTASIVVSSLSIGGYSIVAKYIPD